MNRPTVDVIMPVYKPGKELFKLIELLEKQTVRPEKIILMNTEEKYLSSLLYGTNFLEKHRNLEVHNISKREFNHGKTRNDGAKRSKSEIMIFMTQDAMPDNDRLIEELLKALGPEEVAVAYARQLPSQESSPLEQFSRAYNYPEGDVIKGKEDIPQLGIKTFFCSNVCAAYKKSVFQQLGGFVNFTIFNEDMLYAAKVIEKDMKIAYASGARVIHSHDYSGIQQFHRNFDLGVSQADHPEVFGAVKSESEGIKLVKGTIAYLIKCKKPLLIPKLIYQSGCKFVGYRLGKRYKKLSKRQILKYTMSPDYFKRYWDKNEIPENVYAGYGKTAEEMARKIK